MAHLLLNLYGIENIIRSMGSSMLSIMHHMLVSKIARVTFYFIADLIYKAILTLFVVLAWLAGFETFNLWMPNKEEFTLSFLLFSTCLCVFILHNEWRYRNWVNRLTNAEPEINETINYQETECQTKSNIILTPEIKRKKKPSVFNVTGGIGIRQDQNEFCLEKSDGQINRFEFNTKTYLLKKRLLITGYTIFSLIVQVGFWRNFWNLMDSYSIVRRHLVISLVGSVLGLISMKCLTMTLFVPIRAGNDDSFKFLSKTLFSRYLPAKEIQERKGPTFRDCVATVLATYPLQVSVWRCIWELTTNIFPQSEDETNHKYFLRSGSTSALIGFTCFVFITLIDKILWIENKVITENENVIPLPDDNLGDQSVEDADIKVHNHKSNYFPTDKSSFICQISSDEHRRLKFRANLCNFLQTTFFYVFHLFATFAAVQCWRGFWLINLLLLENTWKCFTNHTSNPNWWEQEVVRKSSFTFIYLIILIILFAVATLLGSTTSISSHGIATDLIKFPTKMKKFRSSLNTKTCKQAPDLERSLRKDSCKQDKDYVNQESYFPAMIV